MGTAQKKRKGKPMKITLHRDVLKYVLTSTIKKEDLEIAKKYRPDALKIKDSDGNDVFGMSYVAGKPCVSKNGVTFGAANAEGFVIVTGDIPEKLPEGTTNAGEYVADIVGAAITHINAIEATLPDVVAAVKAERKALIDGIANA